MEDLILEQINHAGEPCTVTDEVIRMDACRLTSESDVQEEEFLFKFFGTPCFPRGDLTTIAGPAKSGKTFLTTMTMACCVKRQVLEFERISEEPLKVLWFDTEQSRMTTKRILTDRVGQMTDHEGAFPDEQFYVLNVRSLTPEERVDMLHLAIDTYKPDMVIIDGIADMLNDINNGPNATELMQKLLTIASTKKCNITTVIHLNRTGERLNLRGWIGTVMVQKSYEVFNCEKVFKTKTFLADLTFSRRYHLDQTLYYEIDDKGLPFATEKPDIQQRDAQGKFVGKTESDKFETFNQQYIVRHPESGHDVWEWNLQRLFADAIGNRATVSCEELKRCAMNCANIQSPKYFDKLFSKAKDLRIIQTTMDRSGRVVVIMP